MSEHIDMSLMKGIRLVQEIVAGANKVNVLYRYASKCYENQMIFDDAEYALVKVYRFSGNEGDDNPEIRLRLDHALPLGERKDVFAIIQELERCRLWAVVMNIQDPVGCVTQCNLSELNRFGAKSNLNS